MDYSANTEYLPATLNKELEPTTTSHSSSTHSPSARSSSPESSSNITEDLKNSIKQKLLKEINDQKASDQKSSSSGELTQGLENLLWLRKLQETSSERISSMTKTSTAYPLRHAEGKSGGKVTKDNKPLPSTNSAQTNGKSTTYSNSSTVSPSKSCTKEPPSLSAVEESLSTLTSILTSGLNQNDDESLIDALNEAFTCTASLGALILQLKDSIWTSILESSLDSLRSEMLTTIMEANPEPEEIPEEEVFLPESPID